MNTEGTGPPSNIDDATTDSAEGGGGGTPTPEPQMQQSQTPLTASFGSVPATHNGETPFWLELSFDAPVVQGLKRQLRELLSVTGGSETRFRRKDGRLDHWQIRVDPSSDNAVTVTLTPSPPCGETGAVCTDDCPQGRLHDASGCEGCHSPDAPYIVKFKTWETAYCERCARQLRSEGHPLSTRSETLADDQRSLFT